MIMPERMLSIHNVRGTEGPVVRVRREILNRWNTVYFHLANRPLRYRQGRSRIVYIGTTNRGLERIMESVAERAEAAFRVHGVDEIEIHEIGCRPLQRVRTWRKLENAALLTFRETYGRVPLLNRAGGMMEATDEFDYFNRDQILRFVRRWER